MRRFSRKTGHVERQLRTARPEPRADFLLAQVKNVAEARPRRRRSASRVAFALSLATFMIGAFASFGGLSYAASGAASAAKAVKHVVASNHPRTLSQSSARAQYGPTPAAVEEAPAAETNAEAQTAGVEASNLPFTGLSLLFTAVIGFSLLAAGLILRWREKRQT
jgi:hypothetical protein